MADKVIFSGDSRLIIVKPGVTDIDVVTDLYSEWKNWVISDANARYLGAFRTFGGDPTITGQFAPKYFFLINGWRILVDNGDEISVGVNLYTDELENPFIVGDGSAVSLRNSDAAVVDTGVAQNLDYGGVVNINTNVGVPGTEYPSGTLARPVNTISDAKVIAQANGIHNYHIFGSVIIDEDLYNSTIYGGNLGDVVTINGVNVSGTTFKQCLLQGSYIGPITGDNCIIKDGFSGMSGYFQHCGFQGKMYFNRGVETTLVDCHSQVPGLNSPSIFLNEDCSLSMRKYSGGMTIYDSKTGTTVTLEFMAGNCKILSGNTGGQLVIRGIATLTDESTGTDVNIDGLITPNRPVFGGSIG